MMFINAVSLSSVLTIDLVFVYAIMIVSLIIPFGIPYALSISAISHRCMESKALDNSMKRIVAVRFFAFAPSSPTKYFPRGRTISSKTILMFS